MNLPKFYNSVVQSHTFFIELTAAGTVAEFHGIPFSFGLLTLAQNQHNAPKVRAFT